MYIWQVKVGEFTSFFNSLETLEESIKLTFGEFERTHDKIMCVKYNLNDGQEIVANARLICEKPCYLLY